MVGSIQATPDKMRLIYIDHVEYQRQIAPFVVVYQMRIGATNAVCTE